jgi:eukaryotic-like serine/threonine-protein kinase
MAVSPGSRLGRYEIVSRIGAGGMGEVYRARDSKLGRDVAIKVLPEAFAQDGERMARFEREAKLLATLNHPNIASIYGVEESGLTDALVMELAEGPTLADRLRSGPIPLHEALPIAGQIADALEYAHEHAVVHRDLKPANIKISREDTVKILDFGLAKAVLSETSATAPADSPTLSQITLESGVLLGTAAYMAPEQAKAKTVDRRADIWAFGCVLYEVLTAKKAFPGDTVAETLAAVLKNEPDWSQLPSSIAGARPCSSASLFAKGSQTAAARHRRRPHLARRNPLRRCGGHTRTSVKSTGFTSHHTMGAFLCDSTRARRARSRPFSPETSPPAEPVRFQVTPPDKGILTVGFGTPFALSPDGRHLAIVALAQDARLHLSIRDLDSLVARPLPGAEGFLRDIFWSPDSRSLAFFEGSNLERIDISGTAPPQVICPTSTFNGGTWNQDGLILFGSYDGLMKVSAAGGTPSQSD